MNVATQHPIGVSVTMLTASNGVHDLCLIRTPQAFEQQAMTVAALVGRGIALF